MNGKSNTKITRQKKIVYTAFLFTFFFFTSLFTWGQCGSGDFPSISFRSNSDTILPSAKIILKSVADRLKANPLCNIVVIAYPQYSKKSQQQAQRRINRIKIYMIEKLGISPERILTNGQEFEGGDPNTVDIKEN